MTQPLGREALLSLSDLGYEDVEIPALGGAVRVRGITAAERDSYELECAMEPDTKQNIRARLLVRSIVDGEGNRLFKDEEWPLIAALRWQDLQQAFGAAIRLSILSRKAVDDLGKALPGDGIGGSSSGSPTGTG